MDLTVLDELVEEYMLQEELTDKVDLVYRPRSSQITAVPQCLICRRAHLHQSAAHCRSDEHASQSAYCLRQATCVELRKLFHCKVRKL